MPDQELVSQPGVAGTSDLEQAFAQRVDASLERYTLFLQKLLRIPTPRMQEHDAIRFLGDAFAEAGVEPQYFDGDGTGEPTPDGPPPNLFACQKGSGGGRSLLLEAHLDTVPPGNEEAWNGGPWSGRIENGRIYARGAHDDRVGTAMMWMIADVIRQLGIVPRGDLYYLVTTEEEYSDGGMRAYLRRPDRVQPGAHLALDGNKTNFCISAHAGALTFQIHIPGAWGSLFFRDREQENNPIKLASLLIGRFREFEDDVRRRTRALPVDPKWPEPTMDVTEVRSKGWYSNTPEECVIHGFGNVIPPMRLGDYKTLLEEFVAAFARQYPWLQSHPPSVVWGPVEIPSMETPLDSPFYVALANCHEKYFEAPLCPRKIGGWGDMVLLGCPNLIFYGPAGGGGDHTYNEYLELADLAPMLKTLGSLMLRWNGVQD